MCPLYPLRGARHVPEEPMRLSPHDLVAAVRRCLSHHRWMGPHEVVQQLADARVSVTAEEVVTALRGCSGVTEAGGRWMARSS